MFLLLPLTLRLLLDFSACFIEATQLGISTANFPKFITFHVSSILSSYNLYSQFIPVH
jgi:hypothetical protein